MRAHQGLDALPGRPASGRSQWRGTGGVAQAGPRPAESRPSEGNLNARSPGRNQRLNPVPQPGGVPGASATRNERFWDLDRSL